MTTSLELPLFPLNTVLFPEGPLSLRIFEPRYVDMVRRCMREQLPFGVVLIRDGGEVGAVASIADVGTTARIVDFQALPDGLLGLECVGERRFRVLRRWQQPDGLNMAEVEWLPEIHAEPLQDDQDYLGKLLGAVWPRIAEPYQHVPQRFDDASWVGYRFAEIGPLDRADRQAFLEMEDTAARIRRIAEIIPSPNSPSADD